MSGGVTYPLIAEGAHTSGGALMGLRPDVTTVVGGVNIATSETVLENFIPRIETRWHKMFRAVRYTISVIGTTGTAPTAWSLGARFEQRLAHTQGYQFAFPYWVPLQPEQVAAFVAEGVGWYGPGKTPPAITNANYAGAASFGIVADNTMTADDGSGVLPSGLTVPGYTATTAVQNFTRITVSRTIDQAVGPTRVRFQPSITGGDATTQIILSATAEGVY